MDKKRIALIILFLLLCGLLGYLIYKVFFYTPKKILPLENTGSTQTKDSFPQGEFGEPTGQNINVIQNRTTGFPTEQGGISNLQTLQNQVLKIVSSPIKSPSNQKTGLKYYDNIDGKFYRLDANGNPTPLIDRVFYSVDNVVWSPNGKESIIEYPDGSNIYFNFDTKKQITLPKHWEEFSFSPQGDKIAAKSLGLSPENRWIVSANPDGTEVKLIAPMGENANKVTVDWSPNQQVVALSRTGEPLGADRQQILLIGQHNENFRSLTVEGRGLESKWSPDGKKLLYSVYSSRSDFQPELWVDNAEGDNIGTGRKLLNLNTWANKCTFSDEKTVYCGVPQNLETGAGFAPKLADDNPHKLYKINIQSGLKTEVTLPPGDFVIDQIFVSNTQNKLFFTDKRVSGLFEVKL